MGKRLARWYTVPGPLYSRRPMQLSLSHTCKQALKHIVGVACGNRAYRTIIVFPLLIRISVHASAALVCCLDLGGLSLNFWEKRWPIDLRFQKVHHEKLTRMAGKSRFFIHGCFLPSRGYLHLDYFSRFMLFFLVIIYPINIPPPAAASPIGAFFPTQLRRPVDRSMSTMSAD